MALPDQIDGERKRTEAAMHKSAIEQEIKELGVDIHRVTHELSEQFKKVQDTRSEPAP